MEQKVELEAQTKQFGWQIVQKPSIVTVLFPLQVMQKLFTRQDWQLDMLHVIQPDFVVITVPVVQVEHALPFVQVTHPEIGQLVQFVELHKHVAAGDP
jgi:hypothetical protein